MPELPEVETTRRGIAPLLSGRVVTGCEVRQPRLRQPVTADLRARVVGRTLREVRRRGKYLILDFDEGAVLVHLGMSGSLRIVDPAARPQTHDHVDIDFAGHVLRLRDPRRFGLLLWHDGDPALHPLLCRLGPEPLESGFDARTLWRQTRTLKAAIKQVLMDSHRVVGVGNIYASESLFRARVHPCTPAGRIGLVRYRRLVEHVRATLSDAIAAGGSTLRDFVGSDGKPGYFQQQYFVYGREGQACRVCASAIRKTVIAQRATYWCPRCQRL